MAAAQMAFDFAQSRPAPTAVAPVRQPLAPDAGESGPARGGRKPHPGPAGLVGTRGSAAPRTRVPEGADRIRKERDLEQRLSRLLSAREVVLR